MFLTKIHAWVRRRSFEPSGRKPDFGGDPITAGL